MSPRRLVVIVSLLFAAATTGCLGTRQVPEANAMMAMRWQLRHITVSELEPIIAEALTPICCTRTRCVRLPPLWTSECDARSNSIVFRGPREVLDDLREILERMDVPAEPFGH